MDKAGKIAVRTGLGGYAVRTLWNSITENEDHNAQAEAERRVSKASESAKPNTTVKEVSEATEKEKQKIMEKKAPFTKAEEKAKEEVQKIVDRFGGSGSDK